MNSNFLDLLEIIQEIDHTLDIYLLLDQMEPIAQQNHVETILDHWETEPV
jgi:hypothetical protein